MDEPVAPRKPGFKSFLGSGYVHIAFVVLFGLLAYSNTFEAPFQWDESVLIVDNPIVKDLGYFLEPPETPGDEEYQYALRQRYIGYLTFALNYATAGSDVTGFHAVNLAIHLLNAILVYLLVALTFRTPSLQGSRLGERSAYIALLGSVLFVSHPVQTMAVTYVFQRLASLAALFFLLSTVSYAGSRLSAGRGKSYGLYAVSLISAVLAMKTKENAFTLPLVIALYEVLFFRGGLKVRVLRLVPLLLTMLIIPVSLVGIDRPVGEMVSGMTSIPRAETELSKGQYFLTQLRVMATYLRLLFLPVNQNIDYDYPVSDSFLEAPVFLSAVLHLSLLALGVYLVIRSRGRRLSHRLAAFGIFWYFITISVESSIIPLHMVVNEYRVYLPSAGAFAAIAAGAFIMLDKMNEARVKSAAVLGICTIPLFFVSATYARNELWNSQVSLWEDVVRKSPFKARGHNNLATAYYEEGLYDRAEEHFRDAAFLDPFYGDPNYNLGVIYKKRSDYERAVEHFELALRTKPYMAEAHMGLGQALRAQGSNRKAERHLRIAASLRPYPEAHYELGVLYFESGDIDKARQEFRKTIAIKPGHINARRFLGYLSGTGETPPPH